MFVGTLLSPELLIYQFFQLPGLLLFCNIEISWEESVSTAQPVITEKLTYIISICSRYGRFQDKGTQKLLCGCPLKKIIFRTCIQQV